MFYFRSDKAQTRRGYFKFDSKRAQMIKAFGRVLDYNDASAVADLYIVGR